MKWHVFPARPDVLAAARADAVAGAAVPAGRRRLAPRFSYWSYCRMVSTFMDDQMQQLGQSHRRAGRARVPPSPLTHERVAQVGRLRRRRSYGADGALQVTLVARAARAACSRRRLPRRAGRTARSWRVYTAPAASHGGRSVQVLQSGTLPRHLAAERAGAAIAPVLMLLPLAMLVLWGVAARHVARAAGHRPAGRAAGRAHTSRELSAGPRAAGDRAAGGLLQQPAARGCAMPSRRSAASCRMRRTNCARRSRRWRCSWRTCGATCLPAPARNASRSWKPGVRRAQRLVDQLLQAVAPGGGRRRRPGASSTCRRSCAKA